MFLKPRHWCLLAVAFVSACVGPGQPVQPAPPDAPAAERRQQVPAEVLNPDVRQETIRQTICRSGYTASVRPASTYTNGVKAKLLREQGLPPSGAAEYELDHVIPLALGGSPRALQNLALQPWEGERGAHRKDQLERRLQVLVCAGRLALTEARAAIYFDWQGAFRVYMQGFGK